MIMDGPPGSGCPVHAVCRGQPCTTGSFAIASMQKQRHGTTKFKTLLRDRLRTTRAETIKILRRALAPEVNPRSCHHLQPCCPQEADRHGAQIPMLCLPACG